MIIIHERILSSSPGKNSIKKNTAVSRFAALMLEEVDVRKIVLNANDPKKHSIVIKKLKENKNNKDFFKPYSLLDRFKWY